MTISQEHAQIKEKVRGIVEREGGRAISPDFVAWKAGITWGPAKNCLMELVVEKKIRAIETSRGWLFLALQNI